MTNDYARFWQVYDGHPRLMSGDDRVLVDAVNHDILASMRECIQCFSALPERGAWCIIDSWAACDALVKWFRGSGWFGNHFFMISGGGKRIRVCHTSHPDLPQFAKDKLIKMRKNNFKVRNEY